MRGDIEINAEIVALKNALTIKGAHHGSRWSVSARKTIEESIDVLVKRKTEEQITNEFYIDETSSEYTEGDNELYHELMRVRDWMIGDQGYEAPSERL
jgi:hypothetical protein